MPAAHRPDAQYFAALPQRLLLASTHVLMLAERAEAVGHRLRHSDVLFVVSDWAVQSCPGPCTTRTCCDYQRLGSLLWMMLPEC